ncbi:MAG: CoA-binding protein [Bacteroidota bacterium]
MPIEDDAAIRKILREAKTIAVVGASEKPWRDSNSIMQFLIDVGYEVFPVNPKYSEVRGVPCVPDLSYVPKGIDIVDVFRRSEALDQIVDEAITSGARTLWLQLGVVNDDAAKKAEQAGMNVIMDHCIRVDHRRLIR